MVSSRRHKSKMEKDPMRLVFGGIPIICLLSLSLFYADFFALKVIPFYQWKRYLSNFNPSLSVITFDRAIQEQVFIKLRLRRLVRGDDRTKLDSVGFACDSTVNSLVCVANGPVKINTTTMQVYLPTNQRMPHVETIVKPYARQEDEDLLKYISPVRILQENNTMPSIQCEHDHKVPSIIFSTSGFTGNQFHELNEIIIPLFITSRQFKSQVRFIIIDYKPYFVNKYAKILSQLSNYEVINPGLNGSVHCFNGAVVGLKYHGNLALNASEIPGYSMLDFKRFLMESYHLKMKNLTENQEKPILVLVSRRKNRRFLNEGEMVGVMEELGFRVIIARSKLMSDLDKFSKLLSLSSVMVGTHGAGLANEVFMPAGAVTIQVVPLGLTWPSDAYYGIPASGMGLHYLEYKIEPEESSLVKFYGRDHPVVVDPTSVFAKGYQAARAVYIEGQNVKINLLRFRETLVKALKLVQNSSPST